MRAKSMRNWIFGKGSAYIKYFRYNCSGGACRLPSILSAHENISAVGKHLPFVFLYVVGHGLVSAP